MQRGLTRTVIAAMLVVAAAVLPQSVWASTDEQTTVGLAAEPAITSTTTTSTTVVTPEDLCDEFGGPDCLPALAECDALGPGACARVLECLVVNLVTSSASFPFGCWPDQLGEPSAYLCRVFACPGTPPSYCAVPEVARLGWCGSDGRILRPNSTTTTTTTTSTTSTTAPPTTSTTAVPPTTSSTPPPTSTTVVPTTTTPTTTTTTGDPAPTEVPEAPPTSPAPGASPATSPCDPNYAGQCVPVATSVNCSDVPGTNVVVVGTDIHGLDGDGDGIGCEGPVTAQVAAAMTSRTPTSANESDLALTGRSTTAPLAAGLLLLVTGLLLTGTAARNAAPRRGGYSFSSFDDLGLPTYYRVTAQRSRRAERRRRFR